MLISTQFFRRPERTIMLISTHLFSRLAHTNVLTP